MKKTITIAKPFVKWAGGKGRLIDKLESQLPEDFDQQADVTYIEPFVGGGAMLFHMLRNHPNIKRAVINDVNKDLITCYRLIKEAPEILIEKLERIEGAYHVLETEKGRKEFFYATRDVYNEHLQDDNERASNFIFLNRTCFNGLYRENGAGKFNVPFGRYKYPQICNTDVIMADHDALSKVDIFCGDYSNIIRHLGQDFNFVYLDPPYRPLLGSSNFKQYNKSDFGDKEQEELKLFCDRLTERDCKWMLSNSDSYNEDGTNYFEELYNGYTFTKILAPRVINAFADRRTSQLEIIIRNY